ncbi:Biotin synthase [Buchnera aphidicola (Tetraneura ulmi)]|uniref:biotin synthase BioB n=1 Tax=Buchnera aphidicola TaxID=9 RepID=UPI0034647263
MKKYWNYEQAIELTKKPFFNLIFEAQKTHRKYFNPQEIQISTLLSIKTGACPEDCKYCPQSSRYKTEIKKEPLLKIEEIVNAAKKAKSIGSTRFCMGAAWKNPKNRDIPYLQKIVKEIKKLGLETCMTLGSLTEKQANKLADAGLDFYNHNLDTSREYYKKIITTRNYDERIETIKFVRKHGIKVCSGGILGMGEKVEDRIKLLVELSNFKKNPESIPINMLVPFTGTPLEKNSGIDPFDFIKIVAITRIMMPTSYIRLSAGRKQMNNQTQAMCFMAGVNSIFYGCKLLTSDNPNEKDDLYLFKKLNLKIEKKIITKKNEKEKINFLDSSFIKKQNFYNADL